MAKENFEVINIPLENEVEVVDRTKGKENKKSSANKSSSINNKPLLFSDKYEESLIKSLFDNKENQKDDSKEESEYFETAREFHHKKKDGEWDVPLDEEIHYFDPHLSYELTGYRPITMELGLDFDPTPFTETARIFQKTGKYTDYPRGCKSYSDFWREQLKRCTEGYTCGTYRITGDNYFFLNFYNMQTVSKDTTKETTGRTQGFPDFIAKQYEFFHYLEMCEYVAKDSVMLKARGLGFSEILSCLGTRPFITTRHFRTVYTAFADNQLDNTLDKCWSQLNWLNLNTDGGMKRSRQKIDNIKQKRASLVTTEGTEFGRFSEIEGIVADQPKKVRGDRCERLVFEEAGSNEVLIKSWIQADALVELGGKKIGTRIAGGTGGDESKSLEGLSKMFSNPEAYGILPYKNYNTRTGNPEYTGFFIAAHEFSLDPKYVDSRGVTNSTEFRKYYEAKRNCMEGHDLLVYSAEHCFYPEEALLCQGENQFNPDFLSERLTQVRMGTQYAKPKNITLLWKDNNPDSGKLKPIESNTSKILISEPPLTDESGNVYKNLYVAGIDAIDMGTAASSTSYDVSDFCLVIKKRIFGMEEPKYVALYKDRPKDVREAYEITLKLLTWYNCKAMLEYSKISIQQYFIAKNKVNLFLSRPDFALPQKMQRGRKQLIGVPAKDTVIHHGLDLIDNYINDYWYTIDFDEMLEQLLNYTYEAKRKFDIVAAMSMCEIGDESLTGLQPSSVEEISNTWKDFGWYIDENGHRCHGIIEKKEYKPKVTYGCQS